MANVIGRTQGYTAHGPKAGEATRLGSEYVRSEANTWHTFTRVEVQKDGRVDVEIRRDGSPTLRLSINPELATAAAEEMRYRFAKDGVGVIASTWPEGE